MMVMDMELIGLQVMTMKISELLENVRWSVKQLSDSEIIAWCKENAQSFLNQKCPIYRGTDSSTGIIDPTILNRNSANTYNTYNIWIDNYPLWRGFPKRRQALICSTNDVTAELFGDVFLMIPKDTCLIGICPEMDIWGSFGEIEDILGGNNDASDFLRILMRAGVNSTDWASLKKSSLSITPDIIKQKAEDGDDKFIMNELAQWMEENEYETVYSALEDIFDPEINDFKVQRAGEFSARGDKELWVGGGDVMQVLMSEMSDELKTFFKEYYEL